MKTPSPIPSLPTDRKGLIRMASELPLGDRKRRAILSGLKAGAGKTAKIDDEDLNKVLIVMKAHVSRRPDKGWRMMAAPEDAASGPADSGIVADWLGWGGGAATTALRVLQRQGLVNSVKGRTRKNRWYLTPKGLQAAVRAKTTTKLAQKKP